MALGTRHSPSISRQSGKRSKIKNDDGDVLDSEVKKPLKEKKLYCQYLNDISIFNALRIDPPVCSE